ncbi:MULTISPECIES: DUF2281 domain-containing protein [Thioalkalivibrio]|uniref:Uncharacterized protein n=2 Tax=Thioalkalivibrio TaxID=106633 RepID=A0A0G3G983_9GAMM|nr:MULTISPECIES: DUF2281 domain-containing protein [Thioalkalivibrio]AKJ95396.1 hypothetical protein TVD_08515 [Thioalkalivibrio versutus]OOC49813.1 hypothetical protein B0684_04695 [Thioalkalivibrio versutus]
MDIAEQIYQEAKRLPEPLSREVLDFIGYLEAKHGLSDTPIEDLKKAQETTLGPIWDTPEDEVWDDR